MKDVNKTFSDRAARFLPVDMKDRLKSAFNRNTASTPAEIEREDSSSDYNVIFNTERPASAAKTTGLNVPLVGGPAVGMNADPAHPKNGSRQILPDIEDAEIVESDGKDMSASSESEGWAESISQKIANEAVVSQKTKSRFFGDFSSTESVRLKVEKRNEKRATEPPMALNGNSQTQSEERVTLDDSRELDSPAKPNFLFEASPTESLTENFQGSEAVALNSTSSERANIILQEEYPSMDAKAHESENGASADSNSGSTFAAIVIERNSKFSGQLKFAGVITIDGQVEGELIADRIVINEGGIVNAAIDGSTVVIAGTVRGDIRAHNELEILPSGIVEGAVTAPAITVRRGGRVEGRCTIGVPRQ